ncbi:hypothetical protein [Spirosoma telluris]|uniref:hypothetical protein n=1 Tax=Spirosoma telluris TaxID=2183553 RepID=UPI002FC3656E
MNKFMLVFHSPYSQETAYAELSPEAMQAEIQKWNTWIGGIAAQGKLIATDALAPVGKLMTKGGRLLPMAPSPKAKRLSVAT